MTDAVNITTLKNSKLRKAFEKGDRMLEEDSKILKIAKQMVQRDLATACKLIQAWQV